jgi:NitT/TauT family transport system substrate-binding protein
MIRAAAWACLIGLSLVGGCAKHDDAIALNWKPEPEFGGLFAAKETGFFKQQGLDVEFTGGPGAPVVQMVDAGQAAFGIASADEVIIARARGADIVGVFATYQTCPQGLMVHAERGLTSLREVFDPGGLTVAMEPGLAYVKFLKEKYGFTKVKVVPYNYSNALWAGDPNMAQQCFVTSEPVAARHGGFKPQVFLIADAGYNPYTAVVIVKGATWRAHPEKVKALVAALREGWAAYLQDPTVANAAMSKLNTAMTPETFKEVAAIQKPLIETKDTQTRGLGTMTLARWQELADQLVQLKIIEKAPPAAECFANVE